MRKLKLQKEDFAWVRWTPKYIEKIGQDFIRQVTEDYKNVKKILPEERTFENTVVAIENAGAPYKDMFDKLGLLMDTSSKKEIREAAHKVVSLVSQKMIDVEYDRDVYISLKEYALGNYLDEKKKLRKEDIRLIELMLRDYKKMGFELDDKAYKQLKQSLKKLQALQITFSHNINNYSDYILCTKEELDGMSERYISLLPYDTKTKKYTVTLAYPHLHPFLAQATNRTKRKELADKAGSRGGKKNLDIFNRIITLRHTIAIMLGYEHHADFRTDGRTAKNAQTVHAFHAAIQKKVEKQAKKDIEMVKGYGKKSGLTKVDNEDWSYVMWDKSVHVYEVTDKDKSIIGYLALDLYPREGKYGHAAMFDFQYGRELSYGGEEHMPPFGAIVANYSSPNKKHPSLLSAWEVEALFHEMGHSLHLLLSKVPHKSISGTSVAWDFVETPSQIMENWVYEDEILKKLSKHYITGKPMPQAMRNKIVESRTFLQSMGYLDQIFMGELDMEMHSGKTFDINKRYRDFKKQQYGFTLPADKYLFPAGFGHLGGGYDAAYYSYLWSLVLAQDAFSEFRKKGITNSEVGMKWRREVLEKGSSDNEMKLLENFLGRKTNQKAFLEELGIK